MGSALAASALAIFTLGATGRGQAAVLNQDNTVNGSERPARRGSIVQIFATGEGQTSPAGVTGSITQANVKFPVLPVVVRIGGVEAQVRYAGSAPQAVAGLFQVNAVVPQEVTAGAAVPITLSIGEARSVEGVTIAVE